MPNVHSPPRGTAPLPDQHAGAAFSHSLHNHHSLRSLMHEESPPPSMLTRTQLQVWGTRVDDSSVYICCRCTGFPRYTAPLIALFVCRDARNAKDRFEYAGQSAPAPRHAGGHPDAEMRAEFNVGGLPKHVPVIEEPQKEEEELNDDGLTARTDGDLLSAATSSSSAPANKGPGASLKFSVYATQGADGSAMSGGLGAANLLGSATVDLDRLLEKKEGDTEERILVLELSGGRSGNSQMASSAASLHSSGTSTPNFTTLTLQHSVPSPGALGGGASYASSQATGSQGAMSHLASSSASSAGAHAEAEAQPAVYGLSPEAIKAVLSTPSLPEALAYEHQRAQGMAPRSSPTSSSSSSTTTRSQTQTQSQSQSQRAPKPIVDPTAIPRGGKWDLGESQTDSLAKHQASQRMCSVDQSCVIA